MTDAWATDVAAGHETALLAWRRQDVTDLNRLARDRWARLGHLDGDDVEVHSGRWYAPGDRIVALTPNPRAGIVTSEPLRVIAVTEGAMTVRTSDNRSVRLEVDALDADHLDYGYALTVHRAQGATYDRARVLAAGGGRELAYVAVSRARDHTTLHATADDLAQAVDDLQADWGVGRAQRWISTTRAQPGVEPEPARSDPPALLERRHQARERLHELEDDHDTLLAGTGRWQDTEAGAAARGLNDSRDRLAAARRVGDDPDARRSERRAALKALPQLENDVEKAQQVWNRIGAPEARLIETDITATARDLADLAREDLNARTARIQARAAERSLGGDMSLGL